MGTYDAYVVFIDEIKGGGFRYVVDKNTTAQRMTFLMRDKGLEFLSGMTCRPGMSSVVINAWIDIVTKDHAVRSSQVKVPTITGHKPL